MYLALTIIISKLWNRYSKLQTSFDTNNYTGIGLESILSSVIVAVIT